MQKRLLLKQVLEESNRDQKGVYSSSKTGCKLDAKLGCKDIKATYSMKAITLLDMPISNGNPIHTVVTQKSWLSTAFTVSCRCVALGRLPPHFISNFFQLSPCLNRRVLPWDLLRIENAQSQQPWMKIHQNRARGLIHMAHEAQCQKLLSRFIRLLPSSPNQTSIYFLNRLPCLQNFPVSFWILS